MARSQTVSPEARERYELIAAIENARGSKVITYFLADRANAMAQIAEDAVRPMYDHIRSLGHVKRLDLFLYSVGGFTDVPWRIVTMVREHCDEFAVLVPYKAMSAATMIALGADEIVMGRKGELGPIDPQLPVRRTAGETTAQDTMSVEDVMSYVEFLRTRVGLTEQASLQAPINSLTEKLDPWMLGKINRVHSHIRVVARKLLTARGEGRQLSEDRINAIVEMLAEKVYQHGHAIGRREAREMGLNIGADSDELEDLMWRTYAAYEKLCKLREPLDPQTIIPAGQDDYKEEMYTGCIESTAFSDLFGGELSATRKRQLPGQLTINLNLNLQLPPGIDPAALPPEAARLLQHLLQQAQTEAQRAANEEVRRQMPVVGVEGAYRAAWRRSSDWPVTAEAKRADRADPRAEDRS